ncbi:MAG: hypothetical protein JRJ12_08035 [Deltaproteobacteria bacterium]|nr:hypothetical protein [Deltaproteobacteria bacterium]MBW2071408.1 hypothetical protein [Deltaproteobacteria bacterium]
MGKTWSCCWGWRDAGDYPADETEKFFLYNFIKIVAKVSGQGAASCFSCGYGESCKVGVPYFLYSEGVKITEDIIPDLAKQPQVIRAAQEAGKLLGEHLRHGHDRGQVTEKMQAITMAKLKESA